MICIVHQCGAQLRLSLNDKKCGSKGGKGKTHKQGKISHNSNMQSNYLKTKQWHRNIITVAHLGQGRHSEFEPGKVQYSTPNFFCYYFSRRKWKYFYTFYHFYSEKSSKRAK